MSFNKKKVLCVFFIYISLLTVYFAGLFNGSEEAFANKKYWFYLCANSFFILGLSIVIYQYVLNFLFNGLKESYPISEKSKIKVWKNLMIFCGFLFFVLQFIVDKNLILLSIFFVFSAVTFGSDKLLACRKDYP